MICPACKYMMDSFDRECPRCHGKGMAGSPTVTPPPPARTVVLKTPAAPTVPSRTPAAPPVASKTPAPSAATVPLSPASTADFNGGTAAAIWHYASAGSTNGPVDLYQVKQLIQQGVIVPDTLVWRQGMDNWVAAQLSELNVHLTSQSQAPTAGLASSPPAPGLLPGQSSISLMPVSDTLVWCLAVAPILGIVVQALFAGMFNTSFNNLWFVTLLINVGLSMADEKQLKDAGYDTTKLGGGWLVPVYLFKRAALLGQSNAYAIVWIVLFMLSLGSSSFDSATPDNAGSDVPGVASAPVAAPSSTDLRVENLSSKTSEYGGLVVTGTVVNTSDKTFSYVQVEINLYDSAGTQVGSTLDNINNMEAQGRWNFEAPVMEENVARFEVKGVTAY